jgi:thioredoxin-related protein
MKKTLLTTVAVAVVLGFIFTMMQVNYTPSVTVEPTVEATKEHKSITKTNSTDIDDTQYVNATENVDEILTAYEEMMEEYLTDTNPDFTNFDVSVELSTLPDYDIYIVVTAQYAETGEMVVDSCYQTLSDMEESIEGINEYNETHCRDLTIEHNVTVM